MKQRPPQARSWRCLVASCALICSVAVAQAPLPPAVAAALARSGIARDAVTIVVSDVQGTAPARLSHRADVPMNPASIMKLVTTFAALDLLGPAYTWKTPVLVDGTVREGVLTGNLYIRGQGDPKLVIERLWLLLRRVQALGIRRISGDIVLDRSAFETLAADPSSFDGEPLRPYNVAADALLINFKALQITLTPQRPSNTVLISYEPPLAGVQLQTSAPLSGGDCGDYRAALKPELTDPKRIRFSGSYPAACGERTWPVAYADPNSFAARAIEGMWREMGGSLDGTVRDGPMPMTPSNGSSIAFDLVSPSLAEVIRDINKYSNNVMAQQVFLTLSLPSTVSGFGLSEVAPAQAPATLEASRSVVQRWWQERLGPADQPILDSGSGLSRQQRITARALVRLLQGAYASPFMPELMASLPSVGIDGTLRTRRVAGPGAAHLKSGSLRDVSGVAGFVLSANGKRYVLVAIANHPNAIAFRPVIDALLDWTVMDQPGAKQ